MRKLVAFYRRSPGERVLLIKAFTLLAGIRIAFWLTPLKWFGAAWTPPAGETTAAANATESPVEKIVWAVRTMSGFVPGASCLVQALAALRLLLSAHHPAVLKIGTRKDRTGRFIAHAWVEIAGHTVLGATPAESYTPILLWQASGWRRPLTQGASR